MADRFEDLRNYVAVVANGGVNAAAEAMGIAKSAVSRRLSELEGRLGVALVDRSTRRFTLTAVGRDYHRRAEAILASLEALDRQAAGGAAETGALRLAADADLVAHLLVPALVRFVADNPGITAELTVATPESLVGAELDVLVSRHAGQPDEHLVLGELGQQACASKSYLAEHGAPASLAELAQHTLITVAGTPWPRSAPSRAMLLVPDVNAGLAAAIAGGGIAQLPVFVVKDALARGELASVDLEAAAPTRIIASFGTQSDNRVRRLVDDLALTFRAGG